jgi:hypothetical protein
VGVLSPEPLELGAHLYLAAPFVLSSSELCSKYLPHPVLFRLLPDPMSLTVPSSQINELPSPETGSCYT